MAKNANIRFENANVAYVNVDTDTHEMTGGVMDETTGTFYPVGGGGGGDEYLVIPEQAVNITNEDPYPVITVNDTLLDFEVIAIGIEDWDVYALQKNSGFDEFARTYEEDELMIAVFKRENEDDWRLGLTDLDEQPVIGATTIIGVGIYKPTEDEDDGGEI